MAIPSLLNPIKIIFEIIERYSSRVCFDQSENISKNYFNQLQIWYHLTSKFLIIQDTVYVNLLEYENWKLYFHELDEDVFIINHIVEPQPPENMMDIPGMQDEMRRPMMLIVSANKKVDR